LCINQAREEFDSSGILKGQLGARSADERIPFSPYDKWFGAHCVISIRADLGYPEGDENRKPFMEQSYAAWLCKQHEKYVKTIKGEVQRYASREAN
jgi:hypothetical protein